MRTIIDKISKAVISRTAETISCDSLKAAFSYFDIMSGETLRCPVFDL